MPWPSLIPLVRTVSRTGVAAFVPGVVQVPFSGAVTDSVIWIGPGRVMQVVVTAGAAGTIDLEDSVVAGFGPAIGGTLTTTALPTTYLINSGLGTAVFAGVMLTITGANTGYVTIQEEEV